MRYITFAPLVRGWSQKKCTRWQHCANNDAICPAISAFVLENFWKLVQCILSREVCARGNDRALKWRLFVSQVPWLMTISARTLKLKHYAGKLQRRSTVRWWKCVVWKLLNWNLSPVSGEAKVPRDRKNSRGPSRTWNKWWFSRTIVKVWSWQTGYRVVRL